MESGGICANPGCNASLYEAFASGDVTNVEELAHIIGEQLGGPRGRNVMAAAKRNLAGNIILLCPRCHSLVDKTPMQYSVNVLRGWKSSHRKSIKDVFRAKRFASRKALCAFVQPLFEENRAIWDTFGPYSPGAEHPLADQVRMWRKKAIETIVPNNRLIDVTLTDNSRFLSEMEIKLLAAFKIHREAFEFNHLSGDRTTNAPLFPAALVSSLFRHA